MPTSNDNPFIQSEPSSATATITSVSSVSITDNAAKFQVSRNGVYVDYRIMSRYENDRRICMMGITSPDGFAGGTAAFIQLAVPTLLWLVDWTASQAGAQPVFPDSTPGSTRWVLLDRLIEPSMVTVLTGGNVPLYRISGTYVYGCINPSDNTLADVAYGRPPWLMDSFLRTIPSNATLQGLLDVSTDLGQGVGR